MNSCRDPLCSYVVNTDVDGQLSHTGLFEGSEEHLDSLVDEILSFFKKTPTEPNRLLFYAHGGLVTESSAKQHAIQHQYRTFLANGVYPVYFVWESGAFSTFLQHLWKRVRGEPDAPPLRLFEGRFRDETLVEQFAQEHSWIWQTMKERAENVFSKNGGGWLFFHKLADRLRTQNLQAEIHLVGHSTGANLLGPLLTNLLPAARDVLTGGTCSLYAPACTLASFEQVYVPALDSGLLQQFYLYQLSNMLELSDPTCRWKFIHFYPHSLLYLVSRGFETSEEVWPAQVLGLSLYAERSIALDRLIRGGRAMRVVSERPTATFYHPIGNVTLELRNCAETHGGFGKENCTLNSTLRAILGRNDLAVPFPEHAPVPERALALV